MHPYALIKLSKPHLRRQHRVTRGHGGELNATLAQCILTRFSNYQIHTSEDTSSDTRSWWRTKCNTCAMHPYALITLQNYQSHTSEDTSSDSRWWWQISPNTKHCDAHATQAFRISGFSGAPLPSPPEIRSITMAWPQTGLRGPLGCTGPLSSASAAQADEPARKDKTGASSHPARCSAAACCS